MTDINYCFPDFASQKTKRKWPEVQLLNMEPVPYLKYMSEKISKKEYFPCPAFTDYFKNVYVIRSGFDITMEFDVVNGQIITEKMENQGFYEEFFHNRFSDKDGYMFTLPPYIIFYSKKSVMMESLPMFLDHSSLSENLRPLPGTFNIGKWFRSVDFTFEIVDITKKIVIRRGDPLFCVRFLPEDDSKVNLIRQDFTEEHFKAFAACTGVKQINSNTKLNALYKMAENFLPYIKIPYGRKKCPFSFFKGK